MRFVVGPLLVELFDRDGEFVTPRSGMVVRSVGPRVWVRLDGDGPIGGVTVTDPAMLRCWAQAFAEAADGLERKLGGKRCPEPDAGSPL